VEDVDEKLLLGVIFSNPVVPLKVPSDTVLKITEFFDSTVKTPALLSNGSAWPISVAPSKPSHGINH